jgi:hypothetical protein
VGCSPLLTRLLSSDPHWPVLGDPWGLADSINRLRRGQLDPRLANAMGYLASVLLKALENGRIEDRLARLESVMTGSGGTEIEAFEFRPAKELSHEEPATAFEGD